jgi:hypothetical protein
MLSRSTDWEYPIGYVDENVSDKIVKYLGGILYV